MEKFLKIKKMPKSKDNNIIVTEKVEKSQNIKTNGCC